MHVEYYLYGLATTKIDAKTPVSTLNNYRFSLIREAVTHHHLVNNGISNYYLVNNARQSIKMLLIGRVDLIPGVSSIFFENCRREKLDCSNIKPVYKLEDLSTEFYFALSKATDEAIVNRVKKAYQKVIQNN